MLKIWFEMRLQPRELEGGVMWLVGFCMKTGTLATGQSASTAYGYCGSAYFRFAGFM